MVTPGVLLVSDWIRHGFLIKEQKIIVKVFKAQAELGRKLSKMGVCFFFVQVMGKTNTS